MIRTWELAFEKAYAERREFLNACKISGTNSFRLFGSDGLVVDIYGEVGFFQIFEGKGKLTEKELLAIAKWCALRLELRAVYLKPMVLDRSRAPEVLTQAEPFYGECLPPVIEALENHIKYSIRPYDGFSVGLFLDQRENRRFLAENYAGCSVLNLFSYTCGFSVAMALAGAGVTSVDVSKKALEWGKENFMRNSIPLGAHEFFANDARDTLDRAIRKGRRFELVIADPPSFGRGKRGEIFSIKSDWKELLQKMAAVTERALFFSCNYAEWDLFSLKEQIRAYLGTGWGEVPLPLLSRDFENTGNSMKAVLLEKK